MVLVAFAINAFSLRQVVLLLLSLSHLEQRLKPRQPRLRAF